MLPTQKLIQNNMERNQENKKTILWVLKKERPGTF